MAKIQYSYLTGEIKKDIDTVVAQHKNAHMVHSNKEIGAPKAVWFDSSNLLCIEYSSGRKFCYNTDLSTYFMCFEIFG